ncbi:formate dehydrogenase accessory protein FdhE [Pseudomonas sp. GD04058]|uniref:formate dehydrogenase accessory protein FdhE n=1 Tax=Pseudomonas sp. GD04058 TaxID=2975429 RepID=UPI0002A375FF|nr:formate dehydrogenase accessory protein FdhE [Pseudomonas sp. GD04058]MDG9886035.1 formate dehydrogenase accessory protein FdhE [Pseudomonas sp. GD04058]
MTSSIRMTPQGAGQAAVGAIAPVLLPPREGNHARRAARLRELAVRHPMADYLGFVAGIVESQELLLTHRPLPPALLAGLAASLGATGAPLDCRRHVRHGHWLVLLRGLGETIEHPALEELLQEEDWRLEAYADSLLRGDFHEVHSGEALFIWSALSLYFSQLAAHLPAVGIVQGEERQFCPVCASAPVASSILTGAQAGLRYLHCGLCESRWHMVRLKCSNCEATGGLDYWSLEDAKAPVKAESCGECRSYLKVFYPEHERGLEVVADDLATLGLDAEVERQGFGRSGVSPFLFPG